MPDQKSGLPICAKCNKTPDEVSVDNHIRPEWRSIRDQAPELAPNGMTITVRCHGETQTRHYTRLEIENGIEPSRIFFEDAAQLLFAARCVWVPGPEFVRARLDGGTRAERVAALQEVLPIRMVGEGTVFDATTFGAEEIRIRGAEQTSVTVDAPHVATLPDGSTVALPAGTVLREGRLADPEGVTAERAAAAESLRIVQAALCDSGDALTQARTLLQRAKPYIEVSILGNALEGEIDAFLAGLPVTSAPTVSPRVMLVALEALLGARPTQDDTGQAGLTEGQKAEATRALLALRAGPLVATGAPAPALVVTDGARVVRRVEPSAPASRPLEDRVIEAASDLVASGFAVLPDGASPEEDALRSAVQALRAHAASKPPRLTVERATRHG